MMLNIPSFSHDAVFPQLLVVSNPKTMEQLLQSELPGYGPGEIEIEEVKIRRFQYRPRKKCHICYSLEVKDNRSGQTGSQLFYGLLEGKGTAQKTFQNALLQDAFQPKFGPPVHYIEQIDMVLWGFPNDPKLTNLHELFSLESIQHVFKHHINLAEHFKGLSPQVMDTQVVKYVPGKRCVIEHRFWATQESQGEPDLHLYSKTYDSERGEPVFAVMQTLWNSPARHSGFFHMPEPLFYDTRLGTVVTPALKGKEALEIFQETDDSTIFKDIGKLLAGLHSCEVSGLPYRSVSEILKSVQTAYQTLQDSGSVYAHRMASLLQILESNAISLSDISLVPTHGAFRINQMQLVKGQITLFDFDGIVHGHPAEDVSSFLTHLFYLFIKKELTSFQYELAAQHFSQAYRESTDWEIPKSVLCWFMATTLLGKHVKKYVKRGRKNNETDVELLLDYAEKLLLGKEEIISKNY